MAEVNPITTTVLLLVRPARFVQLSVEHDVALEFETNQQLLTAYPNRQLPPERLKNFEDNAWDRANKLRKAFFIALWSTAGAIILGLLSGYWVRSVAGKADPTVIAALQIGAAGIILVATLAQLGWEIRSWKGTSLPEKANRWLFRAQYWLGTFLFVFSMGWSA